MPEKTSDQAAAAAVLSAIENLNQAMNVNFGLFPEPPPKTRGKERKKAQSHRALRDLDAWLGTKAAAE